MPKASSAARLAVDTMVLRMPGLGASVATHSDPDVGMVGSVPDGSTAGSIQKVPEAAFVVLGSVAGVIEVVGVFGVLMIGTIFTVTVTPVGSAPGFSVMTGMVLETVGGCVFGVAVGLSFVGFPVCVRWADGTFLVDVT